MANSENQEKKENTNYFDFSEVLKYYFRKKDPNNKPNLNLRMMHGINKISILLFLMALIVWIVRRLM
ncbi:MAG: hypothetical protein RIF36_15290 [Imperialibacter sp.]|uniref:DUF6728 family protein n=1 Tax=Imperialibacter sp. TaxID=2038411 RepID=UPI0032F04CA5